MEIFFLIIFPGLIGALYTYVKSSNLRRLNAFLVGWGASIASILIVMLALSSPHSESHRQSDTIIFYIVIIVCPIIIGLVFAFNAYFDD